MTGKITIVGLGPGDPTLRTLETQLLLDNASTIILRTRIHPGIDDLTSDPRVSSCDDLYETMPDFEKVYQAIADRVLAVAADGELVFAVPGHPRFGERSVRTILKAANEQGIEVDIRAAVSAFDSIILSLDLDPMADEVQIVDAEELDETWIAEPFAGGRIGIDPTRPVVVTQMYSTWIASHVKLALARLYSESYRVKVIRSAGVHGQESVTECLLHEIDHQQLDHLTSLYLPPLPALEEFRTALSVQRLVARLRATGGCPWDRKQTHQSLRNAVLDEAYEVVETIDDGDSYHLAEELGDLFLLIAMHSQIAHESGDFALEDVFGQVSSKLIRRHPHVFGDVVAETPDQVVATWESVKKAERISSTVTDEVHPFDRLPKSMPVLSRVSKILTRNALETSEVDQDSQTLGANLFEAVRAIVAAGLDPETVLQEQVKQHLAIAETN